MSKISRGESYQLLSMGQKISTRFETASAPSLCNIQLSSPAGSPATSCLCPEKSDPFCTVDDLFFFDGWWSFIVGSFSSLLLLSLLAAGMPAFLILRRKGPLIPAALIAGELWLSVFVSPNSATFSLFRGASKESSLSMLSSTPSGLFRRSFRASGDDRQCWWAEKPRRPVIKNPLSRNQSRLW